MSTIETQVDELIVGYGAREFWRSLDQDWPDRRKEGFLYRLDIVKPLSADVRVWPTIFASENRPEPSGRFGFQNNWSFLDDLRSAVSRYFQQEPMRAWRTVAITLLLDRDSQSAGVPWTSILPEAEPAKRDVNWAFLGYDVGDQYTLSALTNCGFVPETEDVARMRAEWGPQLNEFHLFPRLADAFRFKRFSDVRLRDDHAPCFVYGLWIVQ